MIEDISVTNATVSEFAGTGVVYTATITPAADGPVTIDVAADAATSPSGAGNVAAPTFTLDADITVPTLVITAPSQTQGGPFVATFTFSETVTDFALERYSGRQWRCY